MEYAYIGDVTPKEFGEITKSFPSIVGIGYMKDPDDGKDLICIGVSNNLPDDVIGLYQLIIALWGDDKAREKAWESLDTESEVVSLQRHIAILEYQLKATKTEANQYKADAIKWCKAHDDVRYEYQKCVAYIKDKGV